MLDFYVFVIMSLKAFNFDELLHFLIPTKFLNWKNLGKCNNQMNLICFYTQFRKYDQR